MSSSQPPSSVDSTDTPYRYAAYAQRVRTILLSAHRYVAYTSDIGESFRPVAHPWLVRSAYGISWTYLVGDVGHEGYKAYLRNRRALAPPGDAHKDATSEQILVGMATGNISMPLSSEGRAKEKDSLTPWPTTEISLAEDYRMVMVKRAVFQSIASMGLPAFTIHSVVKYSGRAVKGVKSTLLRTWFPIGVSVESFLFLLTLDPQPYVGKAYANRFLPGLQLGLSVVPFLPYIFDHPVEEAVDWAFGTALRLYGGEDAVRPLPNHAMLSKAAAEENGSVTTAAQLSWEEYKNEREKARELRLEQSGSKSLSSWFGGWTSESEKPKKE
jgi:fission process protein 1